MTNYHLKPSILPSLAAKDAKEKRQAAWYAKALPTFSDTLAFVHQHLWPSCFFARSSSQHDVIEIPRALFDRLVDTLAFTA